MYNVEGKIGGDSDLSERGWQYAKALPALIKDNIGDKPFEVSAARVTIKHSRKRPKQTADIRYGHQPCSGPSRPARSSHSRRRPGNR